MAITEPIRNKKDVRNMSEHYLNKESLRNYVLIVLGVHSVLRISDLLALTWGNVYDFQKKKFKKHIEITEKKTGKKKTFAIHANALAALSKYFKSLSNVTENSVIFVNNRKNKAAISRVQAWRIVKEAAKASGVSGHISCHSLRKTFGYNAWRNNVHIALIMDIYNHSSYAVTRRYLGIAQDEVDEVYRKISIF
jgi:site-specific recombinase XerD